MTITTIAPADVVTAAEEIAAAAATPAPAVVVSAEALARHLAAVLSCAGKDDTLPVLMHVLLAVDGGTLTLAATDRYRMAESVIATVPADDAPEFLPAPVGGRATMLLHRTDAAKLLKMAKESVRDNRRVPMAQVMHLTVTGTADERLTVDGGTLAVALPFGAGSATYTSGQGTFPTYGSLWQPEITAGEEIARERIGVNPAYLAEMCKTAPVIRRQPVAITPGMSAVRPLTMTIASPEVGETWRAILMPTRLAS